MTFCYKAGYKLYVFRMRFIFASTRIEPIHGSRLSLLLLPLVLLVLLLLLLLLLHSQHVSCIDSNYVCHVSCAVLTISAVPVMASSGMEYIWFLVSTFQLFSSSSPTFTSMTRKLVPPRSRARKSPTSVRKHMLHINGSPVKNDKHRVNHVSLSSL